MNDTFLDVLDELIYHHAKFGGDRTMRAGCRCENVVFVTIFVTGRMPRSGKLPVLNLLTGQKSGFSPRRGDSLYRFTSNLVWPTGTVSARGHMNIRGPQLFYSFFSYAG